MSCANCKRCNKRPSTKRNRSSRTASSCTDERLFLCLLLILSISKVLFFSAHLRNYYSSSLVGLLRFFPFSFKLLQNSRPFALIRGQTGFFICGHRRKSAVIVTVKAAACSGCCAAWKSD